MTPLLADRLAYIGLDEADLECLEGLRPTLEARADELVDGFYEHLIQFPETASLLKDVPTRERLLVQQRAYLLSLADGRIDEAHIEARREIGRVHAGVGLAPSWFLGAYARYLALITPHVRTVCGEDAVAADRALLALQRRMTLDAQLAIEAYIERHDADLTELNEKLREAHGEVRRLFDERGEELRATVRRARAAEELADTAALVAGLAHEIGTPMGVIQGHAKLLEKAVDDEKARWRLRTIQEQIGRISRIIQTLLGMARPSRGARVDLSLGDLVDKTLVFVGERMARQGISVERMMGEAPLVYGDPERLQQVFLNLILNAVDAMEQGGCLRVTVAFEGEDVVVRVADEGTGVSPDVRETLFEPFVTTKAAGRGSGLGLAVARGIAVDHGGDLALAEAQGAGACFELRIPA